MNRRAFLAGSVLIAGVLGGGCRQMSVRTSVADRIASCCRIVSQDEWFGHSRVVFEFDGEEAWVVEPAGGAAAGNPWTWTMEWPNDFELRTGTVLLAAFLISVDPAADARTADGSAARPYRDLERAFESGLAYRRLHRDESVEIVLASGDYPCPRTLVPESSFTIRAADGARPRLLGSVPVTGWTRTRMNGRDAWVSDVSSLGLAKRLDLFFLDGRSMTMCRYPNADAARPYDGGWAYVDGKPFGMYETSPDDRADLLRSGAPKQHSIRGWRVGRGMFETYLKTRAQRGYDRLVGPHPEWKRYPPLAFPPAEVPAPGGLIMQGNRIVNNIWYYPDQPDSFAKTPGNYNPTNNVFDCNVYFPGKGKYRMKLDGSELSLAEWRKMGQDVRSIVGDPRFADPEKGDYSFGADSPAAKLGIWPVPAREAGLLVTDLRPSLPVEAEGLREHPEWLSPRTGN